MRYKTFYTEKRRLNVLNLVGDWGPLDEPGDRVIFSLFEVSTYTEKKGFSVMWISAEGGEELDIHGRSLFGLYTCYGKIIIEVLFLRLALF